MRTFLFILMMTTLAGAQMLVQRTFEINKGQADIFNGYLYGNGIVDMISRGDTLWAGTGYGLNMTVDAGGYWHNFTPEDYIGKGGVAALHITADNTIWISTAFDTLAADEEMSAGGGLSYSQDAGETWVHVPQPVDDVDEEEYEPTTTNISNISYDIASQDSVIWITSWAGGLRKSSDMGKTWQVVTIDGKPFWASNDNVIHLAFSVMTENDNLWVGTAGGIGKSSDGGQSFEIFTHQDGENAISGNFVVALGYQQATNMVWAATIEATDTSEYRAVSLTSNGGASWQVVLPGVFAHNFAFDGNRVYVACDEGLYISDDAEHWYLAPRMVDYQSGDEILRSEFYSVNVQVSGNIKRLWAGSSDGLAYTENNGSTWQVHRSYVRQNMRSQPAAYAYPSPFSPSRHLYARFELDTQNARHVDIKIFDFAMDLVKEIPMGDLKPKWDGTNQAGDVVASGVYIYRVEVDGQVTWGKIAVIN